MDEKQAIEKGLGFTGYYSHSKEDMKEEALNYRKRGYKAVVVNVPDARYSRGPRGMGYSVYIEKKYFKDERAKNMKREISRIPLKRKTAKEEYDKNLNLLNIREIELKNKYYNLTGIKYEDKK